MPYTSDIWCMFSNTMAVLSRMAKDLGFSTAFADRGLRHCRLFIFVGCLTLVEMTAAGILLPEHYRIFARILAAFAFAVILRATFNLHHYKLQMKFAVIREVIDS